MRPSALQNHLLLPAFFQRERQGQPHGYVSSVWFAGYATGEHACSIAILLREFMDRRSRIPNNEEELS